MGENMKYYKQIFIILTLLLFWSCNSEDTITQPQNKNYSIDDYLDSEKVNELISEISNETFGNVNSLLIMRNDTLLVEEYFRGYERDDLHVCYSVTKSFTSALIGIAYDKGLINNVDTKLLDYFPEYNITDTSKLKITLENVLTMSAGFEWDEWNVNYYDNNNILQQLSSSSDWIYFVLNKPVINNPGEIFNYNSGLTVLLSGVLNNLTGQRASTFAETNLLNELDITAFQWEEAPNNITNTGWGLHARPIDLLKFGKLYLNKGVWNGKRIISEEWINLSTESHISINNYSEYGYQWWRFSDNSTTGNVLNVNDVFYADGFGNQYIFVIPHLDMVVVTTAENFTNGINSIYILRDYILPAAYSVNR